MKKVISRIKFMRFLSIAMLCIASGCSTESPRNIETRSSNRKVSFAVDDVPAPYAALYSELDQELSQAELLIHSLKKDFKNCPIMAPNLFIAGSYFGPAAPGSQRWNDILMALDGFQELGVNAVSLMISFPNLTDEVKDSEPLVSFYEALASEIHRRKMKLLIEHFVYPPLSASAEGQFVAAVQKLPNPKTAFLHWSEREITTVFSRIRPDYLTIVTEPETYAKFLGFTISSSEYTRWLKGLIASLAHSKGRTKTKLGAGAGVWESESYIQAFAKVKRLDYIDFHFYPLKVGQDQYIPKLIDLIKQVKKQDPKKQFIVSEMWLYKHGADEPLGVFNKESYARNVYDFWSPLDTHFLGLMNELAKKSDIIVMAPYFSQYFFIGKKYDSKQALPPWPNSMITEWRQVLEASQQKVYSPTGDYFKNNLNNCRQDQ